MEMFYIFLENVGRSKISTTTKPPLPGGSRSICIMRVLRTAYLNEMMLRR